MESSGITKYSLSIPLSPPSLDLGAFSLLSETESDRVNTNSFVAQISELKAQLEIVNEDRQRLKRENEKLKQEKNNELSKVLAAHAETQKHLDNDKLISLKNEVLKLRRECEKKDKLLNMMRSLLGGKELTNLFRESQENNAKVVASPMKNLNSHNSKLPATRNSLKVNRSISPYIKNT
ncbi:hypothetical protein SteCoe_35876 [Stentor coeruleus]|uniref:Uncharacterized protein n=1 Tax=Stentor coeruleus TaxID=5963 RepID=A0A1R2ARB8_9CILI|nr:hypothetical protein SteCoe_35876 [Stentor coeruleus]